MLWKCEWTELRPPKSPYPPVHLRDALANLLDLTPQEVGYPATLWQAISVEGVTAQVAKLYKGLLGRNLNQYSVALRSGPGASAKRVAASCGPTNRGVSPKRNSPAPPWTRSGGRLGSGDAVLRAADVQGLLDAPASRSGRHQRATPRLKEQLETGTIRPGARATRFGAHRPRRNGPAPPTRTRMLWGPHSNKDMLYSVRESPTGSGSCGACRSDRSRRARAPDRALSAAQGYAVGGGPTPDLSTHGEQVLRGRWRSVELVGLGDAGRVGSGLSSPTLPLLRLRWVPRPPDVQPHQQHPRRQDHRPPREPGDHRRLLRRLNVLNRRRADPLPPVTKYRCVLIPSGVHVTNVTMSRSL